MNLQDIELGIIIDGNVYVPVPMRAGCMGCDLLKRCHYGENLICEFVDRLTGKNNMLKLIGENTQIEEGQWHEQ